VKRSWQWLVIGGIVLLLVAAVATTAIPMSPDGTTPSASRFVGDWNLETATAVGATAEPSQNPLAASGSPVPAPGTAEPLGVLLAMLRIAPEDRTGYARSLFVLWIDADGNGCDTRNEVLILEAVVKPRVGSKCSLSGGRWVSLYDGLTFSDPSKLQIDHVVPLAEAWDSGASAWTPDRRMRFANDLGAPFALIAVSAATNESKSDDDPTDWLPPARAAECPYLGAWIATKVRWDLTVDQREHDALATDIGDCPATTMPYLPAGSAGENGSGTASPAPSGPSVGGGTCDPAYPTVCIPPPPPDLDCGQIPYRDFTVLPPDPHHFDGDHDGVGCET
jgi:hypothetical protein